MTSKLSSSLVADGGVGKLDAARRRTGTGDVPHRELGCEPGPAVARRGDEAPAVRAEGDVADRVAAAGVAGSLGQCRHVDDDDVERLEGVRVGDVDGGERGAVGCQRQRLQGIGRAPVSDPAVRRHLVQRGAAEVLVDGDDPSARIEFEGQQAGALAANHPDGARASLDGAQQCPRRRCRVGHLGRLHCQQQRPVEVTFQAGKGAEPFGVGFQRGFVSVIGLAHGDRSGDRGGNEQQRDCGRQYTQPPVGLALTLRLLDERGRAASSERPTDASR